MSSTSNVQDLLVNVFRPTYRYQAGTGFVPSLVMSNVTELIAGKVKTDALVVSDSNVNTFIGSNAGCNATTSSNNVGIGYSAMGGIVNADSNVAVGTLALNGFSNGSNNTVIGAGADINAEVDSNIIIGTNTTITNGSNSIIIGNGITWATPNYINLGSLIYANRASNYVGIGTSNPLRPFHAAGLSYFADKVGIQVSNPTYSLDVLGTAYATTRFLTGAGSTPATPAYSFCNVATTGLYQTSDASYGSGALGVSVLGTPRVVVSGTKTYIYGDLDVCGAFSAVSGGGGGGGGGSGTVASNGTAAAPSFTFSNDASTGLHLGGTSYLAFDTSGVQRMCISGGFVGIGTPTPRVALDVSGDISANVYNGPGGTQSAPHYTFSDDRTTGLFFPGANMVGFTAGGTERMRISNGNVGIGTTSPTNALDVSGTLRVIGPTTNITFTNGAISVGGVPVITSTGVLSNSSGTSNSIGGVTLSNGAIFASNGTALLPAHSFTTDHSTGMYSPATGILRLTTGSLETALTLSNGTFGIGVSSPTQALDVNGTAKASNALISGYLRNALTPTEFDISGGNISNSGTSRSTNALVSGYLRNALTPTTFDISGGNISNSGAIYSAQIRTQDGTAALPSHSFSNEGSLGIYRPQAGQIGFSTVATNRMTLDEFGILTVNVPTAAGFASSLNILGDVSADSVSTKNVYLSNANASLPSLAFSDSQGLYAPGTNQLGLATNGVNRILVDSNGRVGIGNGTTAPTYTLDVTGTTATTNALVSGYLRDALTPSTYDISGGNISNSGTITSVGRVSTGSLFRVNSSSNFIYRYGASKATTAPSYGICYATSVANGNGLITYTADTANGDSFTVASNGLYLVSVSIGGGSVITLDENYAATQQIIVTTADASGLIGWNSSGPNENGATFTGYLRSGNTYRLKSYTAFNASWTGTAKSKLFIFPMYTTA